MQLLVHFNLVTDCAFHWRGIYPLVETPRLAPLQVDSTELKIAIKIS